MEIKISVDNEWIRDQLITAFECGCKYWAESADFSYKPPFHCTITERDELYSESRTEEERTFDLDIKRGLQLIAKNFPADLDINTIDADTADRFVQYAAFGELLYG